MKNIKKIILVCFVFILAACSKSRTEENYKSTDTTMTPPAPLPPPAGAAPAHPDTMKMPKDTTLH